MAVSLNHCTPLHLSLKLCNGFNRQKQDNDKIKGHLCLCREDSLKEKYNTEYYKTYFYVIFRACK